jgi:hypothetical protein
MQFNLMMPKISLLRIIEKFVRQSLLVCLTMKKVFFKFPSIHKLTDFILNIDVNLCKLK